MAPSFPAITSGSAISISVCSAVCIQHYGTPSSVVLSAATSVLTGAASFAGAVTAASFVADAMAMSGAFVSFLLGPSADGRAACLNKVRISRHSPKGIRNVAGQLWSTQSKGIPMPKVFEAKTIRNPKGLQFTVGSPQFLARRWRSRVVVGLSPTAAG